MISLRAVLIEAGVMGQLPRALEEQDVRDADIKQIQIMIAALVEQALVQAGNTVVSDLEL